MRLPVADLAPEMVRGIRERILAMLVRSPFRRPTSWHQAIAVVTPERRAIVARLQLAAELREGGMLAAAHEVVARRVAPGELLAYVVVDNAETAGVAFVVVPLTAGVR